MANATDIGREKALTISVVVNNHIHAIAKEVLQEAYRRLGYTVSFTFLPGLRALEWANAGKTDGDVARIAGTEKKYPNLIPVDVPIIHFEGVAFTKSVTKDIKSWSDLKEFKIGVFRGIRYSEIKTEGMDRFLANDMTHLFILLDRGRIDIAITSLIAGLVEAHNNFEESGIHVVGSPLYSAPLYHFVNVRHRDLVDNLGNVLNEMKETGEIEQIQKKALEKLLDNH